MSMAPPSNAPTSSLNPSSASSLLDAWLEARECRPSDGLRAIFESVGTMAVELSSRRQEISTRFLLFAAVGRRNDGRLDRPEALALETFSEALQRDPPAFDRQARKFADKARVEVDPGGPALSANVERLLTSALAAADERAPGERRVTVADLLLCFPPPGSRAEKVMADLIVAPGKLHDLIRARLGDMPSSEPGATTSSDGTPPAAKEEPPPHDSGDPVLEPGAAGKVATPEPVFNDRVGTHADEPALTDLLERGPFASCLTQNIIEASGNAETGASAFIVHLHGPWGSGKSSVLNFLEAALKAEEKPWLVVRFNAWRDQRRQPPWWSLITCIYAAARADPDKGTSDRLWWRWFKWRVRADFMPWLVAGGLVLMCLGLVIVGFTTSIGPTVTTILSAATLGGAATAIVRSLALGSQRAAQTYAELKADPFQPITDLFDSLISAVGRPVAVFIDDLDRCDSAYVVELLEGIQTLMRSAPVTYVVAADRKWICSSFEQKYAKFSPPLGERGRPLGYLFLDKIFQISAAVPQLATDIRDAYWESLLQVAGDPAKSKQAMQAAEEARETADKEAKARVAGLTSHEQLRDAIDEAVKSDDPITIQATRAAAAIQITSAEAAATTQHRLKTHATLLEPNPRSMKRLVNAYGMHQATLYLAGRSVSPNALARWTILELRWPLLADFLAVRPAYVDRLREPLAQSDQRHVPEELRDLFNDELVAAVVGEEPNDCLDAGAVRTILGSVQGDR